jgi:hypothetical protein
MWDDKTRFPLCWPDNWPRVQFRLSSRFGERTVGQAFQFLCREMRRLTNGEAFFLSSNIPRTKGGAGAPMSSYKQPTDPGVAVYFALNKKPVVLACDKWSHVEDNIWALAKHIEALRGQDRWGVGTIEQAFRGYMALPGLGETGGISWWKVLGVNINATPEQVKESFRILAKKHHPDHSKNGDVELWHRINQAYQQAETLFPKT